MIHLLLILSCWAKPLSIKESSVRFSALGRPSMLKIQGEVRSLNGTIDANQKTVNLKLEAPLKELTTGISLRDDHTKNKYLEVDKFPVAQIQINDLTLPQTVDAIQEIKNAPFHGNLTLHGETQPIDGTFDLNKINNTITIKTQSQINMKNFKIETPSYMGIKIAETVQLAVDLSLGVE